MRLEVDGQEFIQKLTVKKDPKSAGSEADIQAQVKLLLEVRDNLNNLVDMINQYLYRFINFFTLGNSSMSVFG